MEMVKQLTPRTRASTEALCKPSSPLRLSISALRSSLSLSLSNHLYASCRSSCATPRHTRPNLPFSLPLHPFFRPSGFSLGKKDILRPSVFQALSLNSERERIERVYYPPIVLHPLRTFCPVINAAHN